MSTDIALLDTEEIIQKLKSATGHENIHYLGGYYIICFTLKEMYKIKGLRMTKDNFTLDFTEFDVLPISFLVTIDKDLTYQYWTIGGRLHRSGDKPAYVSIDSTKDKVSKKWYWYGLLHRTTGPAVEDYSGYFVNDMMDHKQHYQEVWEEAYFRWVIEGATPQYPYPTHSHLLHGWRTRRRGSNVINSPDKNYASLSIHKVSTIWKTDNIQGGLLPACMIMHELTEWHDDGILQDRAIDRLETTWVNNNQILTSSGKLDDEIKRNLISELGIWNAPFYTSAEVEFIILSDYDRLRKTS